MPDPLAGTRFAGLLTLLNDTLAEACPHGQRLVLLIVEPGARLSIISNLQEAHEVQRVLQAGIGQAEGEIANPGNGSPPLTH